jgi:chaperonin cofactor prefoldin
MNAFPHRHPFAPRPRHPERSGAESKDRVAIPNHAVGEPNRSARFWPVLRLRYAPLRMTVGDGGMRIEGKKLAPARYGLAKNHRRSSNYGGATPKPGWRSIFMITQSSKLKVQNSNLKSQISNLKSQISNLKSQISNLKSQISNLKSQISNLKSQNSKLKSQISNLKTQISKLKTQNHNGKIQNCREVRTF